MPSEVKTFRQVRRDAALDALVVAAESAIAEKGYDNTTMQDIAKRAGCASGTLYLYFKSKEELFSAIVARHSGPMRQCLVAAMEGVTSPLERIRRNTEALLDYFNANLAFFRILYTSEPGLRADVRSSLRDSALSDYLAFRELECSIVREAQRAGELRADVPAEELTEFMHGLTLTTLARWTVKPGAPDRGEQFRLLWSFLMAGMKGQALP